MTTIKFNKITTIIDDNKVFSIRKKSDFWNWIDNCNSFEMVVSQNINGVIKKLESKGFNISINKDWGFEWEVKIICNK